MTSSPRWAGRQWRKIAPVAARAISASSTRKPAKSSDALRLPLLSWPIDAQTSVLTTSAPAAASAGSRVTSTSVAAAPAPEIVGSGSYPSGPRGAGRIRSDTPR